MLRWSRALDCHHITLLSTTGIPADFELYNHTREWKYNVLLSQATNLLEYSVKRLVFLVNS